MPDLRQTRKNLKVALAVMVAVDLVVMGLYTGLAVRLLRWLHTPRQQTVVNRTFSGLFTTAAGVLSLVRRAAMMISGEMPRPAMPLARI